MEAITVYPENKDDLKFLKNFLKRTNMPFTKDEGAEDDFELTDEMKRVIDETLLQDRSTYRDADEVMAELDAKYGL